MHILDRWLAALSFPHRVLDLGCGPGSLRTQLSPFNIVGLDPDAAALGQNSFPSACGEGHHLPFAGSSFDMVVCNHSLEHLHNVAETLREIHRVLKPDGRLFVTVPDGHSFSDRLYRLLLCGGGHFQRFSFNGIVSEVEGNTGLHLVAWKSLFSSFSFVSKRNFLPAPAGPLPGPFPRRMRWAGKLPQWFFSGSRISLNLVSRFADRNFSTKLSSYGWALAFGPEAVAAEQEPGSSNVCMFCGVGLEETAHLYIFGRRYRCPCCSGMNYHFTG